MPDSLRVDANFDAENKRTARLAVAVRKSSGKFECAIAGS